MTNIERRIFMSSKPEFVQFIADQLEEAGQITYRKMFGEYGMYCNGKLFAVICSDQLFIKVTEEGALAAPDLETAPPYNGSKPYFVIEDIDNRDFLTKLVTVTCKSLPEPKQKKERKK